MLLCCNFPHRGPLRMWHFVNCISTTAVQAWVHPQILRKCIKGASWSTMQEAKHVMLKVTNSTALLPLSLMNVTCLSQPTIKVWETLERTVDLHVMVLSVDGWLRCSMILILDINRILQVHRIPWKINGWNLRIHPWKMKLIWTKPSFSGPTLVIRGVIYLYPPTIPEFFQHFHQATLRSSPATRRASWFQSCQTLGKNLGHNVAV